MSRLKLDDNDHNIIVVMSRSIRILEKMVTNSVAEFSLTKPQLDVLFILRFSGDVGLRATEIADELNVSKANISGLINKLVSTNYIRTGVDPNDSRAKTLILTDKANEVLEKVLPQYFSMISNIMSKFNETEKNILLEQLNYITTSIESGGVSNEE